MTVMPTFKTKLVAMGDNGSWTCLKIPFNVPQIFGTKARTFVQGTLKGFPFRTSIFPMGDGKFMMMVNKSMQAGAGVKKGDTVRVKMEKANTPPPLKIPPVLQRALRQHGPAQTRFNKMSYSCRKEYVDWITGAKQEATRQRRIEKMLGMIGGGERSKK
jgi:hypothetical protein